MSVKKTPQGTYRVRWRDPDGKTHGKTFKRQADAKRFNATVHAGMVQGTYVDPAAGRVTFKEYAEQWRAMQVHRPGTAIQVEGNLRLHVYPDLDDRPLKAIRPSEIQALVKKLSGSLAPSTVELVYRYLVAILRAAVADKLITESPCRGIRLPSIEKPKVVPLSVERVLGLVDVMPPRYRALVVMAAGTGLRQGEAFGVTVDRIDFLRKTLRVDRQVTMHPGSPPHLAPPKTAASYRTIPLAPVVVEALAAHLAAFPAGPEGLVFTNDKQKPISRTDFGVVWRRAVQDAGAPEGTGMHDLRHFYASVLIRSGASVKVVQERLGHSSAVETLDTYAHLFADEEDRSRQAIEDVLGAQAMPKSARTASNITS